MKLKKEYYLQEDVVGLARDLLGKMLVTRISGIVTAGIICETEAYNGVIDKASHAYGGRRTTRTETMYQEGGVAYVYLCYGIHHLFNVVTNQRDIPHAVLIRGIIPEKGIPDIMLRKNISKISKKTGIGPGNVSTCLGIHTSMSGTPLTGSKIWIEDTGFSPEAKNIQTGPRIGVDYAGQDALLPYRFWF